MNTPTDTGAPQNSISIVVPCFNEQEVIRQTLSSVQSSLARMKVAPDALTAPDISVIQSSISEVTGQTRAVEQAVQEVMSIRSG